MICPQCESENAFAAKCCAECGKPFGPAREQRAEPTSRIGNAEGYSMRKAFLHASFPVGIYLLNVELLYLWYETSLASTKPGIGVLLAGGLSGLMAMPGMVLLGRFGLPVGSSTAFSQRCFEVQVSIAVTAAIVYVAVLVPLLLVAAGARKKVNG